MTGVSGVSGQVLPGYGRVADAEFRSAGQQALGGALEAVPAHTESAGAHAKPGHRPCSVQKRSTSSSSTSASSAIATAAPATHQSAPGSPADK
jgi:hypothetical protein